MRPGFETPTVTVKSVRALPSESVLPDFEIVLHVLNPNNEALKLSGVSYTVSLGGHDVVKGVGNDLPVIEGYGEADLTLTASANLFAGIGLLRDMVSTTGDQIDYEFEAKLDPGPLSPSIRIRDSGEISLNPAAAN
jgi:LEA14-like dessication related protein